MTPMQQLFSPETFEFFARYFLAGFVIYAVRAFYVLGERPKQTEIVFEVIVLSFINQFVWLMIEPLLFLWNLIPGLTNGLVLDTEARFLFFVEVLIQPAFIGLLLGFNLRRGWNAAILRRLSMPVVQPTRRAYDYVFGELREESFIIVTYEDGTTVYGYFGAASFAGSDAANGDLFVERLYSLSSEVWVATDPPRSALLTMSSVRSIEFLPSQRKGNAP